MKMRVAAALTLAGLLLGGCVGAGAFPTAGSPLGSLMSSTADSTNLLRPQQMTTVPASTLTAQFTALQLPATRGVLVPYKTNEPAGTIIIETTRPGLYLVEGDGKATKYPVAVGRREHQWTGAKTIESIHFKPAWTAPEVIARANPNAAGVVIPGGAPNNPMGVGAIVLAGGEYAIHGTNRPASIGQAVSFGCFRMFNEDIADLIKRSKVGARVVVVQ